MSRQIKTIGIVGGLGPESTIDPPIIIHSMDVRELLRQCGANEFGKVCG